MYANLNTKHGFYQGLEIFGVLEYTRIQAYRENCWKRHTWSQKGFGRSDSDKRSRI